MRCWVVAGVLVLVAVGSAHGECPTVRDVAALEESFEKDTCAVWDGRGTAGSGFSSTYKTYTTSFELTCAPGAAALHRWAFFYRGAQLTFKNCEFTGRVHIVGDFAAPPPVLFDSVIFRGVHTLLVAINVTVTNGLQADQLLFSGSPLRSDRLTVGRVAFASSTAVVDTLDATTAVSVGTSSTLDATHVSVGDAVQGFVSEGFEVSGGADVVAGRLSVQHSRNPLNIGGGSTFKADEVVLESNTADGFVLRIAEGSDANITSLTTWQNTGDAIVGYDSGVFYVSKWTSICDRMREDSWILECVPGDVTVGSLTVHVDDEAANVASAIVGPSDGVQGRCELDASDITVYTDSDVAVDGYTVLESRGCPAIHDL